MTNMVDEAWQTLSEFKGYHPDSVWTVAAIAESSPLIQFFVKDWRQLEILMAHYTNAFGSEKGQTFFEADLADAKQSVHRTLDFLKARLERRKRDLEQLD
jgi:hypothetical protein